MRAAVRVADCVRDKVVQYHYQYSACGDAEQRALQYFESVEQEVPADSADEYRGGSQKIYRKRSLGGVPGVPQDKELGNLLQRLMYKNTDARNQRKRGRDRIRRRQKDAVSNIVYAVGK